MYSRPMGGTGGEWNLFGFISRIFIVHDNLFSSKKETYGENYLAIVRKTE
jgi:hypothetical protein